MTHQLKIELTADEVMELKMHTDNLRQEVEWERRSENRSSYPRIGPLERKHTLVLEVLEKIVAKV